MPSYFRQVPNFDYVSRDSDQRQISEYATVKNLFRRGKIRDDIFGNLAFFTKYKVIGDERPDNVAYKIYNDETLDWVVLLSNNILNIQTEWPLTQRSFDKIMLDKYETYDNLYNGIHHYESNEIRDSLGNLIFPSGIRMENKDQTYRYYDSNLELNIELTGLELLTPITNYEYEFQLEEEKRNIFLLKPNYLNIIFNDMDEIMTYKKGSSQYISKTLKRADNIRLY